MANLVIVESPSKASTIKGYLGSNYKVIASKGHVRDLPKSTLGIDIENDFEPHYINIRGKGDLIKDIRKEAKSANKIYLATDPDREGEAISWHLAVALGIPVEKTMRVTFNEITKTAVKSAIKCPRQIDMSLVNAQQARRLLDRIVGYKLSPFLWKNVRSGLSAGRVQSVATRMIVEREEEIRSFVPVEYWTIEALLSTKEGKDFSVRFVGDRKGRIKLGCEEDAMRVVSAVSGKDFTVSSVKKSKKKKLPAPPFTTSTMQQEVSKKLGFQSQKIMKIAQELYEGVNIGAENGGVQGLITYMRTDSTRVSAVAEEAASEFIKETFGEEYLPGAQRVYKANANAQDAHEAIRPSTPSLKPIFIKKRLSPDQFKLYKLIWERFIASQMQSAELDTVSVDIDNSGYIFKTGGYTLKFRGYLAVYDTPEKDDGELDEENSAMAKLPALREGEILTASEIKPTQHFTEPPQRYTEASLIDFFKENGIGRPSTYAPIISIIISRDYVKREGKFLVATPLGEATTNFMREYFPDIIDYEFTASMEEKLDSIENSENTIVGVISQFYDKFEKDLKTSMSTDGKSKYAPPPEESDVECELCGAKMIYKNGRFGKFLACPNYPKCKNTKAIDKNGKVAESKVEAPELAGFKCELCGSDVVVRRGRYGAFYACSNYPKCTFTKQKVAETGVPCPKCSSMIVARHGKDKMLFYSCEKYPECDFSSWDMPISEKCPDCGAPLYYRKSRKSVICKEKTCSYKREEEMTVIE